MTSTDESHHNGALRCSFCLKNEVSLICSARQLDPMRRAYICEECVRACAAIFDEDRPESERPLTAPDASPH
jgi:hypothetical protein